MAIFKKLHEIMSKLNAFVSRALPHELAVNIAGGEVEPKFLFS
jgi:hypothetical protein